MGENKDLPSLDSLKKKISAERKEEALAKETTPSSAMRSGSELIAGIAVGTFLGYYADQWLNTRPVLLILGVFLGMAGGIMNIYRAVTLEAQQLERDEATKNDKA